MTTIVRSLPPYPSTASRKSLPHSQQAILTAKISKALNDTLLSPHYDLPCALRFLSAWATDRAHEVLESLIWDVSSPSPSPSKISQIDSLSFRLAEKLASTGHLDLPVLVDLSVIFTSTKPSQIRRLFKIACESSKSLPDSAKLLAGAFSNIIQLPGLYGLRKTAHCIVSLFRVCPKEILLEFYFPQFVTHLATAYDQGLVSIAESYGGLDLSSSSHEDDWPTIFVQTKIDLLDSFHVIIKSMLEDLASSSGRNLALKAEQIFSIVFQLLQLPPSPLNMSPRVSFNNNSLLADYQQSYDLSKLLNASLKHAEEKNAQLATLESSLQQLTCEGGQNSGALNIILQSNGPSVYRANAMPKLDNKGKAKATELDVVQDTELNDQVSQVLAIFSEYDPGYIRTLLDSPSYPFYRRPEKLIDAICEGTTPSPDQLAPIPSPIIITSQSYVKQRQNAFDNDPMELDGIHTRKKREDEIVLLRDKAYIEEMKADILRRAEAISDDEEDDNIDIPVDLDDDVDVMLKSPTVIREGDEDSSTDEDNDETEASQTILELAYFRDPALFDRSSRKAKERLDIMGRTKMSHEQIEGWRTMLDREPKRKEALMHKYEFTGNNPIKLDSPSPAGPSNDRENTGSRGGRGSGRGRGGNARGRKNNERNKASRGNHNRKAGHDRKMARGGGPSS